MINVDTTISEVIPTQGSMSRSIYDGTESKGRIWRNLGDEFVAEGSKTTRKRSNLTNTVRNELKSVFMLNEIPATILGDTGRWELNNWERKFLEETLARVWTQITSWMKTVNYFFIIFGINSITSIISPINHELWLQELISNNSDLPSLRSSI